MAEDSGGEKSLPASAQKKRKAREEGNIARSQDLSAGAVLLLALGALLVFGGSAMSEMLTAGRFFLGQLHPLARGVMSAHELALVALAAFAKAVLPIALALMVGGVLLNLLQVGIVFSGKPLMPKMERINPLSGFKKFFGARTFVELIKSVLKLSLVCFLLYLVLRQRLGGLPALMHSTPAGALQAVAEITVALWWRIALAMLVLGLADYGYQYWQHDQDLRMTVQEAREEMKEMEGDPQVKRRVRQLQRQIAMQRMMKEVPKADVIITNPTHYAVALRYDLATMERPVVIAKGARLIAQRIRETGMEHSVPIVQKPELARAMYRTLDVGDPIPEELFVAVAEVLSFVYRIDRREAKRRERAALLGHAA